MSHPPWKLAPVEVALDPVTEQAELQVARVLGPLLEGQLQVEGVLAALLVDLLPDALQVPQVEVVRRLEGVPGGLGLEGGQEGRGAREEHRGDPEGSEDPLVGLVQIRGGARDLPVELGRLEADAAVDVRLADGQGVLAGEDQRPGGALGVLQRLQADVGSREAVRGQVPLAGDVVRIVAGEEVLLATGVRGEGRGVLGVAGVEVGEIDLVVLRPHAEGPEPSQGHGLGAPGDVEEAGLEVPRERAALDGLGRHRLPRGFDPPGVADAVVEVAAGAIVEEVGVAPDGDVVLEGVLVSAGGRELVVERHVHGRGADRAQPVLTEAVELLIAPSVVASQEAHPSALGGEEIVPGRGDLRVRAVLRPYVE
jgi:hypothetical protein